MIIYVIKNQNEIWKKHSSKQVLNALANTYHWGIPYYLDSGKPMLENGYISVSHSNEYMLFAYAHQPIGIDCEQIRPIQESLIDKLNLDKVNPIIDWCKREAIVKLLDDPSYMMKKDIDNFYFKEIILDPQYYIILVSNQKIDEIEVKCISDNLI